MPTIVIRDDLETDGLVDTLPQWAPRADIVHAAFKSRRELLPSVRMLFDFLAADYAPSKLRP